MSRMPEDRETHPLPDGAVSADDVEILEVMGVDENGSPLETEEAEDGEDVEVVFDAPPSAPGAELPIGVYSPPVEDVDLRLRMLRLQADFENFKKRIDRERYDHFRYATFELVGRILPVLDNFERAITAARPGVPGDALIEGVTLIQRQLLAELEIEGLRSMGSVGELFDPERHEAVATDPDSPFPPQTVTHVFQRGYFLHDRVLRPAMVRVRVDESGDGTAEDDEKES
jgi:molecular chaperone GrpE